MRRSMFMYGTAALLLIGAGCDSVVEPNDQLVSMGSTVLSVGNTSVATSTYIPFDIRSEHDRMKMADFFRQSLATASPEQAALLHKTIDILNDSTHQIVLNAPSDMIGERGAFRALNINEPPPPVDEGSPDFDPRHFITYMDFGQNPGGRGNTIVGATQIQTYGEFARVRHDIKYSIGSNSYRYIDDSGVYLRLHTSWIPVDCGEPTTVTGRTDSDVTWGRGGPTVPGHGVLSPRECGPRRTYEEDVVESAPGGGGCNGPTSCEDNFPTGSEYCVVRYKYYLDTGEVIESRLLYCY